MEITAIVVEDEKPAREELIFLLDKYAELKILGTADNGQAGLELILEKRPDLVFIDVEMPGMNGLELANKLYDMRDLLQPVIIFTTAYENFALEAFEVEALDYLLKPFSEDRLASTIDRIKARFREEKVVKEINKPESVLPETKVDKIPVNSKGRYKMLPINKILYFSTVEGEVVANTEEGHYSVNANLTELENELKGSGFFRSHRSYLVNLKRVDEVIPWFKGKYLLVMDNTTKTEVPVSRTYIKELCNILNI